MKLKLIYFLFLLLVVCVNALFAQNISISKYYYDNANRINEIHRSECSYVYYQYDKDGNRSLKKIVYLDLDHKISSSFCSQNNGGVELIAKNPNANYKYSWSNNATGRKITNLLSGMYTVTVTDLNNLNNYSCSLTFQVPDSGQLVKESKITPLGSLIFCEGNSVKLKASIDQGYSYQWYKDGSLLVGAADSIFTATQTGSYTVRITKATCSLASDSVNVKVNLTPNIGATANPSKICIGDSIILKGSGGMSYKWSDGISDGVSFTPTTSASYIVTGTDVNGCQNTASTSVIVNPLPDVSIIASSRSICRGSNVKLNGSGALTYKWSDGVIDDVQFIPTSTKTYMVTGTDSNSCKDTASIKIPVNELPIVQATASDTIICRGENVTLYGSGANKYNWTNGVINGISFIPDSTTIYTVTGIDSNKCQNTSTIKITVHNLPPVKATANKVIVCKNESVILIGTGAKTYKWSPNVKDSMAFVPNVTSTYMVTGTDMNGCENTSSITITVNALPNVGASANDTSICRGESIALYGSGATIYNWSSGFKDGEFFVPNTSETYTVTGTDVNGCKGTATINIIINELPTPSIETNNMPTTFCYGDSIKLSSSILGVKYKWNTHDTTKHIFVKRTGFYTVQVTDQNGCTGTTSPPVDIKVLFAPDVTIDTSKPLPICFGDSVLLSTNVSATTYLWNTNELTKSILVKKSGYYSLMATYNNGCQRTSQTVFVKINPLPTVNAGLDTIYEKTKGPVLIGGNPSASGQNPFTYKWTPSDGLNFDNISNPQASPDIPTIYKINVIDGNNCSKSDSVLVEVEPVGTKESNNEIKLSVLPNPTDGLFYLVSPNLQNGAYVLKLLNSAGQIISIDKIEITNNSLKKEISLKAFPSATYFLILENGQLKSQIPIQKID